MKETVKKIMELNTNSIGLENTLVRIFFSQFWQAVYKKDFFWAMSDEKEALRLFGHQEIGWFNSKTEEYRKAHPDASAILLERIAWSSNNSEKISFDIMPAETNHQLLCFELKLKQGKFPNEKNFYLKIGMIPVWSDDFSKIVDYLDKPVVDFHD